jgi:translation initiation factor 2B subunit (eIF-2B alpha/beta/delta family)
MSSYSNCINKVLSDNVSGSGTITNNIIKCLIIRFAESEYISVNELKNTILKIFKVFPNFTLLFHFLNYLAVCIEGYENSVTGSFLLYLVKDYQKQWSNRKQKTAEKFIEEVDINNKNILLHSNSSSVITIFEIAKNKHINCNIWQTVASPVNEGILQAEILAKYGFTVNLIHENAIWNFFENIDMVLLGADLITNDFFINKTGSRNIALMHKPLFLISEVRKIINKINVSGKLLNMLTREKEKSGYELYVKKYDNIIIHNLYFEKVPHNLVNRIVLENGIKNYNEIFYENSISKIAGLFNNI